MQGEIHFLGMLAVHAVHTSVHIQMNEAITAFILLLKKKNNNNLCHIPPDKLIWIFNLILQKA